jgi:hypothetical protein
MKRQEQFLEQFGDLALIKCQEDKQNIGELYDMLTPYLTTDMARGRIINEAWNARDYEVDDAITLKGVHTVGEDGFMEFHVDEEDLQQVVLEMFYEVME